jgi:hypothetical protein
MRDVKHSSGRWLILGWLLPLVLLALPNCGLQTSGGCCLPVDECSENDPECNEGSDDPVNARTAPTTGGTTADFIAGAASAQTIAKGDGWVDSPPVVPPTWYMCWGCGRAAAPTP